jgi:hypothetical protein
MALRKVLAMGVQFAAKRLCSTSRCSTTPALRAYVGQFLSRSFVVLLRKSIPQNRNLKAAAELNVT